MKKVSFLLVSVLLFLHIMAQHPGESNLRSAQGNFNQYLDKTNMKNLDANSPKKSRMINSFNNTENTVGTRFLFDTWVKGDSVIDMQGNYINAVAFLFNFDKMTGHLLVTQDKINILSAVPGGIHSFTLEDKGQPYIFEHANVIDSLKFFQALVKSDKRYSLYKLYATTFKAADIRNDGVLKSGNDYDEYKDDTKYYVVDNRTHSVSIVSLKPKVIKTVMKADNEKVEAYFSKHKAESINEVFLTGLISYLDQ